MWDYELFLSLSLSIFNWFCTLVHWSCYAWLRLIVCSYSTNTDKYGVARLLCSCSKNHGYAHNFLVLSFISDVWPVSNRFSGQIHTTGKVYCIFVQGKFFIRAPSEGLVVNFVILNKALPILLLHFKDTIISYWIHVDTNKLIFVCHCYFRLYLLFLACNVIDFPNTPHVLIYKTTFCCPFTLSWYSWKSYCTHHFMSKPKQQSLHS